MRAELVERIIRANLALADSLERIGSVNHYGIRSRCQRVCWRWALDLDCWALPVR